MIKKILTSKWTRLIFSAILVYLVFSRVDIVAVVREISRVPWWFAVVGVFFYFLVSMIGAYRWSLFLFEKPGWGDVLNFVKVSYLAGFYGLFFPSGVAIDLIKWLPLQQKYPHLTKAKLFSSVMTDRIVGFASYILVALIAAIVGYKLKFSFPAYILWLFVGLFVGMVVFFVVIFNFEVEKLILRIKFWKFSRLVEIINILKHESRRRLLKCFLVSLVSEIAWIVPIWLIGLIFGSGMTLLSVFIFMPIIGLILILPISVAGFGAREGLYLYFFGQLGLVPEKILAVSAFSGVLGILNALLGGLAGLL